MTKSFTQLISLTGFIGMAENDMAKFVKGGLGWIDSYWIDRELSAD